MVANVVGWLGRELLGAVLIRAVIFTVPALGCCVLLNDFAAQFLCAPTVMIGTLDDEAVELRSNEPGSAEAVGPNQWFSIYWAGGTGRTRRNAPTYASVAECVIARGGDGVDERVVAYRAEEIRVGLCYVR